MPQVSPISRSSSTSPLARQHPDGHHPEGAPLVSILTPAYNAAEFIEFTIESALRQTFGSFELLIVDDGSSDETMAIAQRYAAIDDRVRPTQQPNGGIATARNAAIARARGRYFALLDSDDLWLPTYLADQIAIMEAHPSIGVLSANAINFGGVLDGEPLLPLAGTGLRRVSLLDLIQHEDSMSILSVFRREVLDAIGPFDPNLRRSEDYDYWLRAAHAGFEVAINPKPLALYRRRPTSLSAAECLMLQAMRVPLEKLRGNCPDPEIRRAIDAQLAAFARRALLVEAREAIVRGNMAAAERLLGELADATGERRYRLARHAARTLPAAVRVAYSCKRGVAPFWSRVRRSFHSPWRVQRAAASL